jgi:hypothetical protein
MVEEAVGGDCDEGGRPSSELGYPAFGLDHVNLIVHTF